MQFDLYGKGDLPPGFDYFEGSNFQAIVQSVNPAPEWATFQSLYPAGKTWTTYMSDPVAINEALYLMDVDDHPSEGSAGHTAARGLGTIAYMLANVGLDPRLTSELQAVGHWLHGIAGTDQSPTHTPESAVKTGVAGAGEFYAAMQACANNNNTSAIGFAKQMSSCWADLAANGTVSDTSAQNLASSLCTLAVADNKAGYQPGYLFGYPVADVGGTYYDQIGYAQVDLAVANGYGSYTGLLWDDLSDMTTAYNYLYTNNRALITTIVNTCAIDPTETKATAWTVQTTGATPETQFVFMSSNPGTPADLSLSKDPYLCTLQSQGFFSNAARLVFAIRLAVYSQLQNGAWYPGASTLYTQIDCLKAKTAGGWASCCFNFSPGAGETSALNIATGCPNSAVCAATNYACLASQGLPPPGGACPAGTDCCQQYYNYSVLPVPSGCLFCSTASCCATDLGTPPSWASGQVMGCGTDPQSLFDKRCPDPNNNGWPCDECYGQQGTALADCCTGSADGLGILGPTCVAFTNDPCNPIYGPATTCCDTNPNTPTCQAPADDKVLLFAGLLIAGIVGYTYL